MSAVRRAPWGWHQLTDTWARRLVRHAAIHPGDLVLDVGAGHGAITAPLLAAGARVVAIEMHTSRAQHLRERFADQRVTVVRTDASDLRLPRRPFHVVANPPFAISMGLLMRLLQPNSRLESATVVLPMHLAARFAGREVRGAGRWSKSFDAHVLTPVPRNAFRPPPPGRVAILRISRRNIARSA